MTTDPGPGFEDRLLHALVNEHAVLTGPAYAAAPADPTPRPARRRWHAPRQPAVAMVVAAVAVLVFVGLRAGHPGGLAHPPRSTAAHHSPAQVPTHANADYVVHRILSATAINRAIVVEVVHAPDSQTGAPTVDEIWSQHGNDSSYDITLDAAGRPVTGTLLTQRAARTIATTVDYGARTYSRTTYSPNPPGGPAPVPMTLTSAAAQLRHAVTAGTATLAGQTTVDGHSALEIVDHSDGGTIQLYVDPDTYLPIREVDIPAGGTVSGASTITDDSRYLPDTAANRAKLTPGGVIPSGFRKAR
jgi:hypothetical protein